MIILLFILAIISYELSLCNKNTDLPGIIKSNRSPISYSPNLFQQHHFGNPNVFLDGNDNIRKFVSVKDRYIILQNNHHNNFNKGGYNKNVFIEVT